MFRKAIKVKSNNQLRSSDRKHLVDTFLKCYPNLKEDEIKEILPKRDSIALVKIETSASAIVEVYVVQKRAVAFKINDLIFPTVYTLWRYPNFLITFTTFQPVLSKLKEGADLMLPGVRFPSSNIFCEKYGTFPKDTPCCVNLEHDRAPLAVGVTACSSGDMFINNKGKCVVIYHVVGDKLCTLENLPMLPVPELPPPDWILNESYNPKEGAHIQEIIEGIGELRTEESNNVECLGINQDTKENDIQNNGDSNDMDKLVKYCFLNAIKFSKNIQLPILTSTFYKTNMIPYCPKDTTLDLKKSSYKKVSNFLKEMAELGIIALQETKPGVDSIVEINATHPMVLSFHEGRRLSLGSQEQEKKPVIEEAFTVTAAVLPIFAEFGIKKGFSLQGSEIRNYVKDYVKKYNLQDNNDPKKVKFNSALKALFKDRESATWEELFQKLFSSMGSCFKIQNKETEIIQRGKLEPIVMTVLTRSGNKKVTLVDNLETYGINIDTFAKECQQGVAASTTVNTIPGRKSKQLLVQGNQIIFVSTHLLDKYKIPKKYISGIENAPKKKK